MPAPVDLTALLHAWRDGADGADAALADLIPAVYDDLHLLAHRQLGRLRPGDTLNTTALVHEAYERLAAPNAVAFQDRVHFFAVAARAMRFILIDYARRRGAGKRGGDARRVPLDEAHLTADALADELLSLDDALDRLAEVNARLARVVECHFFGGMTFDEIAAALDVSARTVHRDWQRAKLWLYDALHDE